MSSQKQVALADLMHWIICIDRGPQSYGPLRRLFRGRAYKRVLADLYLIHKIPLSILDPDYTPNDIDFINFGIRSYVQEIGESICPRVGANLLDVVDGVPASMADQITWTVPDWLRTIVTESEMKPRAERTNQST